MKLGMVIRTDRCVGCQTCVISCKVNNLLPGDFLYNKVETKDSEMYVPTGTFPNVSMVFIPQQCNHCEEPKCMEQCSYGAITIKETGIVELDRNKCVGCQACVTACPYNNVKLEEISGLSAKCTFCEHRILNGEEPYCVANCPSKARIIGDLSNPNSEVSKLIAEHNGYVLKPEERTKPKVYYIGKK